MSTGGSYDPKTIESEIYRFWEEGGYFHAEPNPDKPPYVIDIPLPNVTGALHLGHALNNTVQDLLIRHKRMCGYEALWMPGLDHAGIATQAVVERRLKEEQNLTRHDLGRDELVKRIWDWKEEYGQRILHQLRQMGFSCDWARTRFTLDEICAKAVYEVFFQWFKAGLIYRGTRLVNWDAFLQTAVADDEVVYETVKGSFWHYRYPILPEGTKGRRDGGTKAGIEGSRDQGIKEALARAASPDAKYGVDYLSIATTRPETMLGDTAVCVHPDDERYKHLVGRYCLLPLMNRPIPIIADGELAKMELGTGCVKVTPGHDPKDYACGLRNSLPMINILTPDGKIRDGFGAYSGRDRYAARKQVVADLEALGLLEKIEPYETEVGHSDRSKTPIEPMLSEQWFVKMADLAEMAMEAARDGRVQFFPQRYVSTYLDWLGEKRDWCISRQLWWGHRIPVWRRRATRQEVLDALGAYAQELVVTDDIYIRAIRDDGVRITFAGPDYDATRDCNEFIYKIGYDTPVSWQVCPRYEGVSFKDGKTLVAWLSEHGFERDPDVLDTWFSSGIWPFSTLGWPHENEGRRDEGTKGQSAASADSSVPPSLRPSVPSRAAVPTRADFNYFFPTSTLVTGRGIITLWVARMVMTALYFTKRVPFHHVHIHPIIQDGQGRTMSKSLGNGVDPLDIIELYGTDALRFTMAQMDTETQDVRMPVKPVTMPDGRKVNSSEKFELGRNFCNKLWQAATGFVLPNLAGIEGSRDQGIKGGGAPATPVPTFPPSHVPTHGWPQPLQTDDLAVEDRWILSRLAGCIADCDRRLAAYQVSDLANGLYSFFWSDFCDWYVELVKPRLFAKDAAGEVVPRNDDSAGIARQVLACVLDQTLRLLHPIVPFITEELWHRLNETAPQRGIAKLWTGEKALIKAAWPDAAAFTRDEQVEREIAALQNVIRALRDTLARINTNRAAAKTPAIGKLPRAVIRADEAIVARLQEQHAVLERLGRCEYIEIGTSVAKPPDSATQVLAGVEVYVPLAGLMDLGAERARLRKERDELVTHMERLTGKLANEGFVSKAPAAVVEQERARLAEMKDRLASLERNLADIEG